MVANQTLKMSVVNAAMYIWVYREPEPRPPRCELPPFISMHANSDANVIHPMCNSSASGPIKIQDRTVQTETSR